MKQYQIPCGKKSLLIQIPDEVPVQCVTSREMAPIPDVRRAVEEALGRPVGSGRLRDLVKPGQTVALVVTDITRKLPEDIILPLLIKELEAGGIRKKDITAVVATGTHRPNTPEELREMFGEKVVNEILFINHDAWDPKGLVRLGTSPGGDPSGLQPNGRPGRCSDLHRSD